MKISRNLFQNKAGFGKSGFLKILIKIRVPGPKSACKQAAGPRSWETPSGSPATCIAKSSTRRAGYVDTLLVFLSSTPASHMASTAVRYLTLQRVDGSTQRTSVVVTDPLLCPPELDLYSSVPPFVFVCWGVLAPRRLASPQSLSCAIQQVAWISLRRRRLLLLYSSKLHT